MLELIVPYLVGTLVTLAAVLVALVSFLYHRRSADSYQSLIARLPEACRLADLTSRVGDKEQELEQLQAAVLNAQEMIAHRQQAEEWLRVNGPRYDELQGQLPLLTAKVEGLQQETAQLTDQRSKLQGELVEAAGRRDLLRAEAERLEARNREAAKEAEELRVAIAQRRAAADAQATREAALRSQVAQLEKEVDSAKKRLREAGEESAARVRELRSATTAMEQARAEHARLGAEIGEMKEHFTSLQKRIADSVKILPQDQASEEAKLAELWVPVLTPRQGGNTPADEMEALGEVERYLAQIGLQFSPRVVRAFHTSVKTADVSPLVVLAGISGTGKSELPRRYAEAMGMHFLNIPVQPRWDSPQDMFGFYNYLENRYRATELARALVQMDRYRDEPGRGWVLPGGWDHQHSRRKDMLLVLLDEMNLARVEYYFSEFLSRLETRRGICAENPAERRKAEIGLEVGLAARHNGNGAAATAGQQQPTMQVFVGTNVLFVGTMNEDESTQTLSDKVIDRANLMRFGRPGKLAARRQTAATPPAMSLSFSTWENWLRREDKLEPAVSDEVNKWIGRLNEAMQLVRRPFAFRTSLAVRTYVANYPDPAGYRDAMADQIEMKLLPKFRGLDPSEPSSRRALQGVKEVLRELGDQALVEAVQQCEAHGTEEHQFAWQGVDRSIRDA